MALAVKMASRVLSAALFLAGILLLWADPTAGDLADFIEHRKLMSDDAGPYARSSQYASSSSGTATAPAGYTNCVVLSQGAFNLWWTFGNSTVVSFLMEVKVPSSTSYAAIGWNLQGGSGMLDSSVVIGTIIGGQGAAVNYYINDKDTCSTRDGVCPFSAYGKNGGAVLASAAASNGVWRIAFNRTLAASDPTLDVDLSQSVKKPTSTIFAIGPIVGSSISSFTPQSHVDGGGIKGSKLITLSSTVGTSACTPLFVAPGSASAPVSAESPTSPSTTTTAITAAPAATVGSTSSQCTASFNGSPVTFSNCTSALGLGMTLYYTLDSSNTLTGLLTKQHNGWIGLGFNPSSPHMVGSSAVIGAPAVGSGSALAKQYYLAAQSSSGVQPGGSLTLTQPLATESVGGTVALSFGVKLTASQASLANVVVAYGASVSDPTKIPEHDEYAGGTLSFASGSADVSSSNSRLRQVHGVLNTVAWALLVPIGIIAARFFKHRDPLWFHIHRGVQVTGYILALAGFGTGLKLRLDSGVTKNPHFALGVVIIVLATLQVLALVLRPNKDSKPRRYWNWYHWWTGRIAFILAVAQLYIGLDLIDAAKGFYAVISLLLLVIAVAYLVLEGWMWHHRMYRSKERGRPSGDVDPSPLTPQRRDIGMARRDEGHPLESKATYGAEEAGGWQRT